MTTVVSGVIDQPDVIATHEEPASEIAGQPLPAGTQQQIVINGYKNTGNVPQKLTITINSTQGATLTGFNLEVGGQQKTDSVTLSPNQSATLRVNLQAPSVNPGNDSEYSFSIEPSWSNEV